MISLVYNSIMIIRSNKPSGKTGKKISGPDKVSLGKAKTRQPMSDGEIRAIWVKQNWEECNKQDK